ncbi:MAG: transporter, partial [Fusobacteriales bacterium]|nr:transporter [Fusobacteriales bacterium]
MGIGNIDVNGQHNYGLRVPTVFDNQTNGTKYFDETLIDGSGGVIKVAGTENVGISLSKRITGSTLVAGVQGLAASNSSDIIGNIRNLRILVDGTKGVGILRNENFVTTTTGEIELNNTHIQSLGFGDNAQNSVLIRNDKYGVALNKNITIDNTNVVNTATDNIVMLANDKNSLGGKLTYVNNKAGITIGSNLQQATALLSMNGGHALNSGSITINGMKSQGISVFGASAGTVSTGENSGSITVSGKDSLGVYNTGTFTMSGGQIISGAENSIGAYSEGNTSVTNITDGNITAQNGGIALYSGDNSTINLSGSNIITAKAGGLAFYNHVNSGGTVTGKYDITVPSSLKVESGGMLLYAKVGSLADISTVATAIKGAFSNAHNMTANMDAGSNIMYIDSLGGTASITAFAGLTDITTGFFDFMGTGYNDYVMNDFKLTLDNT